MKVASIEDLAQHVVVDENGCWIWQRYTDRRGYGTVRVGDRAGQFVHRVAYELSIGPIPAQMTVDHVCFVPACCNPDHLRLLSLEENTRLQRSALKTHCVNGHEFTPENTYLKTGYRAGKRMCRACNRDASRARRRRA